MALIKSNFWFTSLMIIVMLFGVAIGGTVHEVGDSGGWTMSGVDYKVWASSRTFQVGDSLVFEYNKLFHNVTEVSPEDFELCDPSKPLARYQTGSDMVTLTKPGFHHFICGVGRHCLNGQKLKIHVVPASLGPVTAPQYQMAPSPLQSGASKSASWIGFSLFALILAF